MRGATPPLTPPHPSSPNGLRRAHEGEGNGAEDRAPVAVDWDAVREAYELSGESVAAILARFGITKYGLQKRCLAEGWTTRPQIAKPGKLPPRKPIGPETIALRLNRLLITGMAMLATRLAEEGLNDQNARTLTELCRAEEIRMRSTRTKTGKTRETKNHNAGTDFRDDPAWLRAELDRRLGRLGRPGADGDRGPAATGAKGS